MLRYKVKIKGITEQELNWLRAKLNNEFDEMEKARSILSKMKVTSKEESKNE